MNKLKVGFHTGSFNSAYFSFLKAVEWAQEQGIHNIECGFIDGVMWNHGLGYFPHLASWEDPREMRDLLDARNIRLSQIDAAFPISDREGPSVALPYIKNAIHWAALAGCPMVDTTDGLFKSDGLSDAEALAAMKRSYVLIMETAERYGIVINIETHGYFTANPERMAEMLDFVDSSLLRMTFDTGNVYIAGNDPPKFLTRFLPQVSHVHIKDVTLKLSEEARGKETGIGMSTSAIGEGVNAEGIRLCVGILKEAAFSGTISLECDAQGGPVMERSLDWFRALLDGMAYPHDLSKMNPEAQ